MDRLIIKFLHVAGSDFRVVIYQSGEGLFSYAKQWKGVNTEEFGDIGPPCGFYETAADAENEARLRVNGLEPLGDGDTLH